MENNEIATSVANKEIVDIANKLIEDCIETNKCDELVVDKTTTTINKQENESPNEIEIQVIEQTKQDNKKEELETQEEVDAVTPKETTAANSCSEDETKQTSNEETTTTSTAATTTETPADTQTSSDTTSTKDDDKTTKTKQKKTKKDKKSKDLDSTSNGGKLIEGEVKRKESIGVKIKRVFTLGKSESKKKSASETQPSANGTCHANGDVNGHVVQQTETKQEDVELNKQIETPTEVVTEVEIKHNDETKTETTVEVIPTNNDDKTVPAVQQEGQATTTVDTTANGDTATVANDKLTGKHSNQNCIII